MRMQGLSLGAVLAIVALPANANGGIPLLMLPWAWNLVLLVPVVLLELFVLRRRLALPGRMLLGPVSIANLVTTGLGHYVVLFGALIGLQELLSLNTPEGYIQPQGLIWQAVGLLVGNPPSESITEAQANLMFFSGLVVALVPFFLASWLVETCIVGWIARLPLRRLVWPELLAHLASYAFLMAMAGWLIFSPGTERILSAVSSIGLDAFNLFQGLVEVIVRLFHVAPS